MVGSRTIKVLAALVAAMTVGAFALIVMLESGGPVRPGDEDLAALRDHPEGVSESVFRTAVPPQPLKWRNIVIHSTGAEGNIASRCHFVIHDRGSNLEQCIQSTALWKRQAEGNHVFVAGFDYNANSIGVCLAGDFASTAPSARQFEALVALVNGLQRMFNVPRDRVYLLSDLNPNSQSPGQAFPAERLNARLLKASR